MPLKSGHLTPREEAFAKSYAATGSVTLAARAAGYASEAGASMALARPAVASRIDELFTGELQGQIVPLALKRLKGILTDPKSAGPSLNKAIDTALRHGFAKRESAIEKPSHEQTFEELMAEIREAALTIEGFATSAVTESAEVGAAAGQANAPAVPLNLADVFG